jgi:hypothetical protein
MKTKATPAQYATAYDLYCKFGPSAVYGYANENNISYSPCEACDTSTPDCEDESCLVCGSVKEKQVVKIRKPDPNELIPDAENDISYTLGELEGAVIIESDDVTGNTAVKLKDGRVAILLSIDLE